MAKPKLGLRRFSDDCSSIELSKSFSNKTAIHRSASMVSINCEFCGLSFCRKASEVKRNAKSYCGVACMGADRRRDVDIECRACKKPFKVRQSSFGRITCCSNDCKRKVLSDIRTEYNLNAWKSNTFDSIKGEGSHFSKIDNKTTLNIAKETGKHCEIARRYGLSRSRISRIIKAHNPLHTGLSGAASC